MYFNQLPKKWITVPFLNYYFSYTYTTIYYSILLIVMILSFLLLELQCASKKSLSDFMKQRWVKLIHKRVSKHYEARIEQQEEIWISIAQFRTSILNTWDITINIKKKNHKRFCLRAGKNSQKTSLGLLPTFMSLSHKATAVQVHIQCSQRSTEALQKYFIATQPC